MIPDTLLALDTATDVASVAAMRGGVPAAAVADRGARRHAAQIVPLIDRALRAAGLTAAELGGIVVGDGPGSFTGLRIAWAAAKGLAHGRGTPLFAAPSLMALAYGAWEAAGAEAGAPVLACYDALRGQVFAAIYRFAPRRVETVVAPAVTTAAELVRRAPVRPRIAAGDGARRYAGDLIAWMEVPPLDEVAVGRSAAEALLALMEWSGGAQRVTDPATREPAYGRPAEAQVKWEARHGRPLPDPTRAAG